MSFAVQARAACVTITSPSSGASVLQGTSIAVNFIDTCDDSWLCLVVNDHELNCATPSQQQFIWATRSYSPGIYEVEIRSGSRRGRHDVRDASVMITLLAADGASPSPTPIGTPTPMPSGVPTPSPSAAPTPSPSAVPTPGAGFVELIPVVNTDPNLTGSTTATCSVAGANCDVSTFGNCGISSPSSQSGPNGLWMIGCPLLDDRQAASVTMTTPLSVDEAGTGCADGQNSCGSPAAQQAFDYYFQNIALNNQADYESQLAYFHNGTDIPAVVSARIDGACPIVNPTLAEAAQWAAYKWGENPKWLYGDTEGEGNWDATALGDNGTSVGPWQIAYIGANHGWTGLIGSNLAPESACFDADFYAASRWATFYGVYPEVNSNDITADVQAWDTGSQYSSGGSSYQVGIFNNILTSSWVDGAFNGVSIPDSDPPGTAPHE
jgi:hypothetical protein